jgi:hypothetical protein
VPVAKNRKCGLFIKGKICGKPAYNIEGNWFPLQGWGQLWFYCDEHWAVRNKLRRILGQGYAHAVAVLNYCSLGSGYNRQGGLLALLFVSSGLYVDERLGCNRR